MIGLLFEVVWVDEVKTCVGDKAYLADGCMREMMQEFGAMGQSSVVDAKERRA